MFKYDYSTDLHPTVPIATVEVINPNSSKSISFEGIIDTGADITCIPEIALKQLALDYTAQRVMDFTGKKLTLKKSYVLIGLAEQIHEVEVFLISDDRVSIGRDILNHYKITLDAPNGVLSIE